MINTTEFINGFNIQFLNGVSLLICGLARILKKFGLILRVIL
jgi:hypothetical protein